MPLFAPLLLFSLLLAELPSAAKSVKTPLPTTWPQLIIERSSGHSGSAWLATLLAAQDISTFFQFGGVCTGELDKKAVKHSNSSELAHQNEAAMRRLFRHGCECLYTGSKHYHLQTPEHGPVVNVPIGCNAQDQASCAILPYCQRTCAPRIHSQCRAVAVVGATLATGSSARLANDSVFMTWDRDNTVKHAISSIKSTVKTALFPNHLRASDAPTPRSFIWMLPAHLLASAMSKTHDRESLQKRIADNELRVVHEAHYEDFQRDTTKALKALLSPVGLKVTLAVESQLVKATSEDLSQLLVNFAEVDAVFAQWPCLRAQLMSTEPELFDPCPKDQLPHGDNWTKLEVNNTNSRYEVDCARELCGPADCGGRNFTHYHRDICAQTAAKAQGDDFVLLVAD